MNYLIARLRADAENQGCLGARFVIAGYSSGAEIVGDVMQTLSESSLRVDQYVVRHIAGVVLYGDPRFNPHDSVDQGSFNHGRAGVRTMRPLYANVWHGKLFSYCLEGDPICNLPRSALGDWYGAIVHCVVLRSNTCAHGQYANDYAQAAGTKLAALVGQSLATPMFASITLPDARVGTPYQGAIFTTGGTSPLNTVLQSGHFPPGLVLLGSSIGGTPTTRGFYSFALRVIDSKGAQSGANFTIRVT